MKINVNTATEEELIAIKHVGPTIAQRIVAFRPYKTFDEFIQITNLKGKRVQDIINEGFAFVETTAEVQDTKPVPEKPTKKKPNSDFLSMVWG